MVYVISSISVGESRYVVDLCVCVCGNYPNYELSSILFEVEKICLYSTYELRGV
jgi:hypothetical protein